MTFHDRGIKHVLKLSKKNVLFIIQLSKHSVGLFKLEFQQNMLNISKKVESKPNKLEKLMYNGKFSNLKLHFLKFINIKYF